MHIILPLLNTFGQARYASPRGIGQVEKTALDEPKQSLIDMDIISRWY